MIKNGRWVLLCVALAMVTVLSVTGVMAMWVYFQPVASREEGLGSRMTTFDYGEIYIVNVIRATDTAAVAHMNKTADTTVDTTVDLGSDAATAVFEITFYNGSEVTYYYNKAETLSSNNTKIGYKVSGIQQKDAVPPATYKTLTVTVATNGSTLSDTTLAATIYFNFVVDKDSIGVVVAKTVLDRFKDILNNVVASNSYTQLETAMNNRSGWNKASDVTYIGNVVGSNASDSRTLEELFSEEFLSMDLDGDGKAEPITMMIKRENLDNNQYTGADYTYTNQNRPVTVYGAEMTIYITSQNLSNTTMGRPVVVYAATLTKFEGTTQWVELVHLTKGTAPANNYTTGDYGRTANSFNTEGWRSDSGETMNQLVQAA